MAKDTASMGGNSIYRTPNFGVHCANPPHVDREDGGHLVIAPHERVRDRQSLQPKLAIELMRLTIVTGQALTNVLREQGIDIGRINYQDNGNWSVFNPEGPFMHVHIYGRARGAIQQPYGQALHFPHIAEHPEFYAGLEPLRTEETSQIREEIGRLFGEPDFSDELWEI